MGDGNILVLVHPDQADAAGDAIDGGRCLSDTVEQQDLPVVIRLGDALGGWSVQQALTKARIPFILADEDDVEFPIASSLIAWHPDINGGDIVEMIGSCHDIPEPYVPTRNGQIHCDDVALLSLYSGIFKLLCP